MGTVRELKDVFVGLVCGEISAHLMPLRQQDDRITLPLH
jgi:hypothetical protein